MSRVSRSIDPLIVPYRSPCQLFFSNARGTASISNPGQVDDAEKIQTIFPFAATISLIVWRKCFLVPNGNRDGSRVGVCIRELRPKKFLAVGPMSQRGMPETPRTAAWFPYTKNKPKDYRFQSSTGTNQSVQKATDSREQVVTLLDWRSALSSARFVLEEMNPLSSRQIVLEVMNGFPIPSTKSKFLVAFSWDTFIHPWHAAIQHKVQILAEFLFFKCIWVTPSDSPPIVTPLFEAVFILTVLKMVEGTLLLK